MGEILTVEELDEWTRAAVEGPATLRSKVESVVMERNALRARVADVERERDVAAVADGVVRGASARVMGELQHELDAAIARLAEVESERDVETALKRDLEEARDDWCADCKSVDFANADASEAFANERAAIARAEAAEKRAEEAERRQCQACADIVNSRDEAESDATALREVLNEVLKAHGDPFKLGGETPSCMMTVDLFKRATALAAGQKEGK